jgi:hypothetical protein
MARLAGLFTPRAEVVADFAGTNIGSGRVSGEHVVAMLARRPGRVVDVATACGVDGRIVAGILEDLALRGVVTREASPDGDYYRARNLGEASQSDG